MPLKSRLTLLAVTGAAALFARSASADVVISSDPTQNMTCSAGTCAPTDFNAVLNISDLQNMLASGDLTVVTDFKFGKHKIRCAGNIDLVVSLSWSNSSKLALGTATCQPTAAISAPLVVMANGSLSLDRLTLTSGGSITFWDVSSTLTIGTTQFTLAADLPTLAGDMAANPKGAYALPNAMMPGAIRSAKLQYSTSRVN